MLGFPGFGPMGRGLFALSLLAGAATAAVPEDVLTLAERRLEQDGSPEVRSAAARLLASSGHAAAREILIEALAEDPPHQEFRYRDAVHGLAAIGGTEIGTLLATRIAEARSAENRALTARHALRLAPAPARAAVRSVIEDPSRVQDWALAGELARHLREWPDAGGVELLEGAFRRFAFHRETSSEIVRTLQEISPEDTRRMLLSATGDPSVSVRLAASRALAATQDPALIPLFARLFREDRASPVRLLAARLLARRDAEGFLPAALAAFEHDDLPDQLGGYLAYLLGESRYRPAEAALLESLRSGSGQTREAVIEALGKLGTQEALAPILALLDPGSRADRPLRESCLRALGGYRLPEARARLDRTLHRDPVPLLVRVAASALAAQDHSDAWSLLHEALGPEHRSVTRAAATARFGTREEDVEFLGRMLATDPDPAVRERAVWALAETGSPRRYALVGSGLEDPSGKVQAACLMSMSVYPDWVEAHAPRMRELLATSQDSAVRLYAMQDLLDLDDLESHRSVAAAARREPVLALRGFAHGFLLRIDPEIARAALAAVLQDEPETILRQRIPGYLAELGAGLSFPALRRAVLRDVDPGVRRNALLALEPLLEGASTAASAR